MLPERGVTKPALPITTTRAAFARRRADVVPQNTCRKEVRAEKAVVPMEAIAEKRTVATMKAQVTRARNRAGRENRQRLKKEAGRLVGGSDGSSNDGSGGSGGGSSGGGGRVDECRGVDEVVRGEGKRAVRPTTAQRSNGTET